MSARWWSVWLCGFVSLTACSQPPAELAPDGAPEARADAAPAEHYPDAYLRWGSYDSFYLAGSWVAVTGDGSVGHWIHVVERVTDEFPPDEQVQLPTDVTDELFRRWEAVDKRDLPRPGTPGAFALRLYVRTCAECEVVAFDYWRAEQVEPELDPLRAWFEDHVDPGWIPPRNP